MERRTYHTHTQHSGVLLLIVYFHLTVVVGTQCNQRFVRGAVNERQFSENRQATTTCLEATMHVNRVQSRVRESAGFGNEEGAHVENITAMKLTDKLETLKTSRLLDISGDTAGF